MGDAGRTAVRLEIRGRVQGVGYRDAMRVEAVRLGVTGWVRNRLDGSVEALCCADARSLGLLEDWARHGPPPARVERLDVFPAEPPAGTSFERLPTA